MKKLLSISILALLLVLVACQIKTTDTPPIEDVDIQLELSLNNEARGIDFLIDIKIESDLETLENIEVGLYYKLNATTEDLDNYLKLPGSNKLTTNQLKDEEVILSLND